MEGGKGGKNPTHRVWSICGLDALALEQKPHRGGGLALPLAKGGHELLQLGAALDLEEDLVVVIRDFDVKVLGRTLRLLETRLSGAAVVGVVGHGDATWEEFVGCEVGGQRRELCGTGVIWKRSEFLSVSKIQTCDEDWVLSKKVVVEGRCLPERLDGGRGVPQESAHEDLPQQSRMDAPRHCDLPSFYIPVGSSKRALAAGIALLVVCSVSGGGGMVCCGGEWWLALWWGCGRDRKFQAAAAFACSISRHSVGQPLKLTTSAG